MKYKTWEVRDARVYRIKIEMIDADGHKIFSYLDLKDFPAIRAIAICDEVRFMVPEDDEDAEREGRLLVTLPERKIVT